MTQGQIRRIIPAAYSNLAEWPTLDISVLPHECRDEFLQRKLAVELYASDVPYKEIAAQTGKCDEEVRRLVKRCITSDGNGNIHGFRALARGIRVNGYTRRARVSVVNGVGGCAGALQALLERYPTVATNVETRMLKLRSPEIIHEAKIAYTLIHKAFLRDLREKGVTDNDWPFNTKNKGYNALREYCVSLRERRLSRWIRARYGDDAASKEPLGNGYRSIVPNLRAYSFVQLDYFKVDAASIIIIRTPNGTELEVALPRWYVGFLIEEKYGAVLGFYIALEINPSADTALETIENALRPKTAEAADPRYEFTPDNKVVIHQFLPELAYQSFAALKVDNAWCNSATGVVNNVIDVIGCAVNFGPVRQWWSRALIENIIGKLAARGLQRLPSTYGSGPDDPRRTDPVGMAMKFKIMLSELVSIITGCVRECNTSRTEHLHFASPVETMRAALQRPQSGLFPQPLPLARQQDLRLLWHVEECTVRGNIKKHVRPYFKTGRTRYTNIELANSYHLVGKKLVVYTDRRNCEIVYATVKETGQELGRMKGERRWEGTGVSWQFRNLINREGLSARLGEEEEGVIEKWAGKKVEEIRSRKKSGKNRTSPSALALAKHHGSRLSTQRKQKDSAATTEIRNTISGEAQRISDPFGFFKRAKGATKGQGGNK